MKLMMFLESGRKYVLGVGIQVMGVSFR